MKFLIEIPVSNSLGFSHSEDYYLNQSQVIDLIIIRVNWVFISFWVKVVIYICFFWLLGLSCVLVMVLELRNKIFIFAASRINASIGSKKSKKFVEFEIGISKIEIGIYFDFLVLKFEIPV